MFQNTRMRQKERGILCWRLLDIDLPFFNYWSKSTILSELFLKILSFSICPAFSTCLFLVVNVNLPFSTYHFRVVKVNLPFSTTGWRLPYLVNFFWRSCLFLVDLPFSTCLFLLVDVDLPFSSCLFLLVNVNLPFSNWPTCLFLTGQRPLTSILQPFSSRPTIFINDTYMLPVSYST